MVKTKAVETFISRWQGVTASELATAQSFVMEFCDLLDVTKPHPTPEQDYMFERPVTFAHGDGSHSAGRIDCYRRGHFVLEAKKLKAGAHTKGFDDGLLRARSQGEAYARALPVADGRPPFVLVVDVGTVIEVYAEFSRSGATYIPFPDPRSHRIALADLARPEILERLRRIWTDPESLNPARISAEVTRAVSQRLALLARSLEKAGHPAPQVAAYLTRCLFSMFAEDVALLPQGAFLGLLKTHREDPAALQQMLRILWTDMDVGGFSAALVKPVLKFNGKLFKGASADGYSLRLTTPLIDLLILAAQANWREVEPAIFGTLLERALDPAERHALGAHYTPRAYVERLVLPTVMEPLRAEWGLAQAAALLLAHEASELEASPPAVTTKKDFAALDRHHLAVRDKWHEARQQVKDFHHRLCTLRVLDPACGSANFLYVTLEHLKRLEGEVLNQLNALGETQDALDLGRETVTLQQLRGIELNERAAALAELVLWIGFLQWHIRSFGNSSVAEPVVHDYGNIEHRDAVLAYDSVEPMMNDAGRPVMRWDGVTTKAHPATGQQVPDEAAQVVQWRYINPRQAQWPVADFIVGNPPYIGARTVRLALGDGYLNALRSAHPEVPENADFVMYWWNKSAGLVNAGDVERFGLITTNSLRQTFNRAVLESWLERNVCLSFAIPDHPWVDSSDGAAVRVALTVVQRGKVDGHLLNVEYETPSADGEVQIETHECWGLITPSLTIGIDVPACPALKANKGMSCVGYQLTGTGFRVARSDALNLDPYFETERACIRSLLTGSDITRTSTDSYAMDLYGLSEEDLRRQYPAIYQWVYDKVKPGRDQNNRASLQERWWIFGEARSTFRPALKGCTRAIATSLTAKHRTFIFVRAEDICDSSTVMFALPDALHMGVLSSRVHVAWALVAGGRLGVGNDPRYNKSKCFESFPFPNTDTGLTTELTDRIRGLAEQIDAHRKARQAAHADVTLTALYNVLEKLRGNQPLSAKDKTIHEHGLVGVLRSLHDELDAAVLAAYGWADLSLPADTDALLLRLVELNTKRAHEEAAGTVRWLRPDFQRGAGQGEQTAIEGEAEADGGDKENAATTAKAITSSKPWPTGLADQIKSVADVLEVAGAGLDLEALAARFSGRGRWRERLPTILDALVALGRARTQGAGRWFDAGR
jgi:hypothetical protein